MAGEVGHVEPLGSLACTGTGAVLTVCSCVVFLYSLLLDTIYAPYCSRLFCKITITMAPLAHLSAAPPFWHVTVIFNHALVVVVRGVEVTKHGDSFDLRPSTPSSHHVHRPTLLSCTSPVAVIAQVGCVEAEMACYTAGREEKVVVDGAEEARAGGRAETGEGAKKKSRPSDGPGSPSIRGSVSHGLRSDLFFMGHDGRWACHQKTACPRQS